LACSKNLSEVGIFTVAWNIDRGATRQPGSVAFLAFAEWPNIPDRAVTSLNLVAFSAFLFDGLAL
jgi:hypothetical protein